MKSKKIFTISGLILAIISVVLFSGCECKQPDLSSANVIYVPQKCQAQMPLEPEWSEENGTRAEVLRGVLENSGKKDSLIYDLKAIIHKCID